ncbi:MAG: DUF1850 domain-containing protein [Burkholderiaceae bacterium]|nr:DUF1850 domain-containing protein [Burkholderiaceae bacterium]
MIAACLLAGAVVLARIPGETFTLRWLHSVEHVAWEEDYEVHADHLELVGSRVRGSGAGMEPEDGGYWRDGAWQSDRHQRFDELALTRSPYAQDYEWCRDGTCRALEHWLGAASEVQFIGVKPC